MVQYQKQVLFRVLIQYLKVVLVLNFNLITVNAVLKKIVNHYCFDQLIQKK